MLCSRPTEDALSGPRQEVSMTLTTTIDVTAVSGSEARAYVLGRYDTAIRYYWSASAVNKRWYKWTRYLTVVLGAGVTLLATLAASSVVTGAWSPVVSIATPLAAALLTITGGLSQTFQWGAAWQEMVLTAERLERERDRLMVMPPAQVDPVAAIDTLNELVLSESAGFFKRILGSAPSDSERELARRSLDE
jgi:hypothetical protein